MPMIHAIEVSNFLNHRRESPWKPDWPCDRFLLGCYHAALNIPNGRGKSTIVLMLLSMLAGQSKTLNELMRTHGAPESTGAFTHLRVEITHHVPGHDDLLLGLTGPSDGERMVFGVYGNAKDGRSFDYYAYRGTFDDCPLAVQNGPSTRLINRDTFLECLRKQSGVFPASQKERRDEEWKRFTGEHFDMASIKQQYAYQMANAAEGSSTYFDVSTKGNYSAELFYKRLAPELLADVMGNQSEDDERGIEDTIHEKASSVVLARKRTREAARELDDASRVLACFKELDSEVEKIESAQSELKATRHPLAEELAVLETVVVTNPIPGSPRIPEASDPDLYLFMVLQRGEWWVSDHGLSHLLGEPVRAVNQRAERIGRSRSSAHSIQKSQHIEFYCDLKKNLTGKGHATRLYDLHDALHVCSDAIRTTLSQEGDHWLEELKAAFEWARNQADTNPARQMLRMSNRQVSLLATEKISLETESESVQARIAQLKNEEDELKVGGSAWEVLHNSGFFTDEELTDPAATGEAVKLEAEDANQALDTHRGKMLERNAIHQRWQEFQVECEDGASPGEMAKALDLEKQKAEQEWQQIHQDHSVEKEQVKELDEAHSVARATLDELGQRHAIVLAHQANAKDFDTLFSGEAAQGLEQQVTAQLEGAKTAIIGYQKMAAALFDAVSSVHLFQAEYPGIAPADWLEARKHHRNQLNAQQADSLVALGKGQETIQSMQKYWSPASTYEKRFTGESTEGLEANVQAAHQHAVRIINSQEHERLLLQPDLDALDQFTQRVAKAQPREWLLERGSRREQAQSLFDDSNQLLHAALPRQQIVLARHAQSKAYDGYFLNEAPEDLAGKVVAELSSANLRRTDLALSLTYIQKDLDAVEHFFTQVADMEPAQWLRQWHEQYAAVLQKFSEVEGELEQAIEKRLFLEHEPLVPSQMARTATEIAGPSAQPLYTFVETLELSDSRKETVLSLFSALLFAPVLQDVTAAAEVASRLAEAKIEVPVFARDPLAEFCRGDAIIYQDGVAEDWLVGVHTWSVACLLNPALIEQERARLDASISEFQTQIEKVKETLESFKAEEPFTLVAAQAKDAMERGVPERGIELEQEIEQMDRLLPKLIERASLTARETIQARLAFAGALGLPDHSDWESLSQAQIALQRHVEELQSCIFEATTIFDQLAIDADLEPIADRAAKAIEDQKPDQAKALNDSVQRLKKALPDLEDRTSAAALNSIRAMASLQDLLGLSASVSWLTITDTRKSREDALTALKAELRCIDEALAELAQSASMEAVAAAAVKALLNGVPDRYRSLIGQQKQAEHELPALEMRASSAALVSIRAVCAIELQLQGATMEALDAQFTVARDDERTLSQKLHIKKTALSQLDDKIAESHARLSQANSQAYRINTLVEIQEYLDDSTYGPAFMTQAPAQQSALRGARDRAQRRAAFSFTEAAQYTLRGGSGRITTVRLELAQGEQRLNAITESLKENQKRHDQLREDQNPLNHAAQMIDEAVIRVRHAYVERKKYFTESIRITAQQLQSNVLYCALFPQGERLPMDIARDMTEACEMLESEDSDQLMQRYKSAVQELQRCSDHFAKLIDKALSDTYLKLPEIARIQLEQSRMSPAIITGMYQATQQSYAQNLEANRIADDHLNEAREGLSGWLANFTLRLPDNLKTMRQVFAPKIDPVSKAVTRAGFIIEAKTIDADGVKSLIESIIQDVEAYESSEQAPKSSMREMLRRSLRESIRENFYRKVVVSPRIYLVLPAISAIPLEMERKMASSGQGIAITFLWILRLAEFVGEREIRRQTVGAAQRRRLRDKATSFTIVDGAFSHLSSKELIDDTLKGIEGSTGRFQLIVTVHDPAYQNDFNRFPALVVAREMRGHYMRSWSHLNGIGEKDALGRDSIATFHTIQVPRAPTTSASNGE